jgi:hypothetical protein
MEDGASPFDTNSSDTRSFGSGELIIITRATLSQYTSVTEAFDRDVGIIYMHIGDMLWAISGKYLDILSSLVIFLSAL